MSFKIASDQMVNGFTLQEKTFAKDYAEAAYLDADSRTVCGLLALLKLMFDRADRAARFISVLPSSA